MGCCNDCLTCDIAFNAVMPLSRASTRGRYSRIEGVTTLFTNDEKTRYYFILKLFPFSLKGDAKTWFNSLDPGCVHSPQDMIYYFSAKYFPAHKKQADLRDIYIILCKLKKRVSHKLGGGFSNYLMLCLIILSRKMKYLISFIMD